MYVSQADSSQLVFPKAAVEQDEELDTNGLLSVRAGFDWSGARSVVR